MLEREVALLDVHRHAGRNDDVVIAEGLHLASSVAGKADGGDLHLSGLMEGLDDVL